MAFSSSNEDKSLEFAKSQYYEQNNVSETSEVNISLDAEEDDSSGLRSFEFIYYPEGSYPNIPMHYTPNREFKKNKSSQDTNTDSKENSPKSSKKSPKGFLCKSPVENFLKVFTNTECQNHKTPELSGASSSSKTEINEKPWRDFRAPIDFIRSLTFSPPRSSNSLQAIQKPKYVKLEYPFKSVYDTHDIIKHGRLCLRKLYIHTFTNVYVALLKNGTMIVKDEETSKYINFEYYLKDCIVEESGLIFRLSVRDEVSTNTLHFLAENNDSRDEWITAINKLTENIEETQSNKANSCDYTINLIDRFGRFIFKVNGYVEEFEFLKVIGRGSFGKLFKCKHRKSDRNYIMKVMRKDLLSRYSGEDVLQQDYYRMVYLKHKYLQKTDCCCVTEDLVVLGMPYPIGGCLGHYILGGGMHDEKIGAFYGSQLATVIIYLHSKNIILRSLTIHDLYLDHEGNLKLVDFGLCPGMGSKRYNRHLRQHPCYVAPELLQEKPYSIAVDWWAYGVCCYVMITGKEPFIKKPIITEKEPIINLEELEETLNSEEVPTEPYLGEKFIDEEQMHKEFKIYAAIENEELDFTSELSRPAVDFLENLLNKIPKYRSVSGAFELAILEHEFFSEMMYYSYNEIEIIPPLRPPIKDDRFYYTHLRNSQIQLKGPIIITPPGGGKNYTPNQLLKFPEGFNLNQMENAPEESAQEPTVIEQ